MPVLGVQCREQESGRKSVKNFVGKICHFALKDMFRTISNKTEILYAGIRIAKEVY
jgi:hypothetical protein